jgi:hypothetical protein
MKLTLVIAALAVSLGLSFAAGAYLAPAFFHSGSGTGMPAPPVHVTRLVEEAAPSTLKNFLSLPAPSAEPAPSDLASILNETNTYRMDKDLTSYADRISAADMPDAIDQAESLTTNANQRRPSPCSLAAG